MGLLIKLLQRNFHYDCIIINFMRIPYSFTTNWINRIFVTVTVNIYISQLVLKIKELVCRSQRIVS